MSKKVNAATVKGIIRASEPEPVALNYPFAGISAVITVTPDMCFTDGLYQPYMYRLAWGYQILIHYTNLTLPSKAEQVWALINQTDLLSRVTAVIGDDLAAMEADIREGIRARLSRSKWDDVADNLAGLTAKMLEMDNDKLAAIAKEGAPEGKILPFMPAAAGKEES